MMKKTIYRAAAGILILSTAAACNLDLTPEGSITYSPGESVITSEADLDGFEANIMASMREITSGVYDYASDIQADYFNATADFANNGGGIHRSDASFTASSEEVLSVWKGCYTVIKNFNVFLEGAKDVPSGIDPEKLKTARGEAYFGRAYAYMVLVRHFAKAYRAETASTDPGVPLVTVYDQNARPSRASVKAVYDRIRTDLDSAAVLLGSVAGAQRATRPSSDAVDAMYARYCLDTGDWTGAISHATKVIGSGTYRLTSNSAASWTSEWVYDAGSEAILQYYASAAEGVGFHSYYYTVNKMGARCYTAEYYIPTRELVNAYSISDRRRACWFGTEHPAYDLTIVSRHLGQYFNENPGVPDYYVFSKFKGNPNYIPSSSYPDSGQARKPLTLGEMYLIAAEAYCMDGDLENAAKYLNELQNSRNAGMTDGSLESVKTEWYRETVGDGQRMTCLKRWGDGFSGRTPQTGAENIVMTGTDYDRKALPAGDYRFVWPIPTYEMKVNPNLIQNEGYSDLTSEGGVLVPETK